jgi:hypothetical protein
MEETVEKFKSIPQIYFHCVRSRGRGKKRNINCTFKIIHIVEKGPRLARQYQECLVKSDHSANQKVITWLDLMSIGIT